MLCCKKQHRVVQIKHHFVVVEEIGQIIQFNRSNATHIMGDLTSKGLDDNILVKFCISFHSQRYRNQAIPVSIYEVLNILSGQTVDFFTQFITVKLCGFNAE